MAFNGIITEVEVPLAPSHPWCERIAAFPSLSAAPVLRTPHRVRRIAKEARDGTTRRSFPIFGGSPAMPGPARPW